MLNVIDSQREKRQFPRLPVALDVNLHMVRDGKPVSVEVTVNDLSLTGLGLEAPNLQLEHLEHVEVSAASCAGVDAKVQWCQSGKLGLHLMPKPHRVARSWIGHVLSIKGFDVSSVRPN